MILNGKVLCQAAVQASNNLQSYGDLQMMHRKFCSRPFPKYNLPNPKLLEGVGGDPWL